MTYLIFHLPYVFGFYTWLCPSCLRNHYFMVKIKTLGSKRMLVKPDIFALFHYYHHESLQ